MNVLTLAANLASLAVGGIVIAAAFRMDRAHRLRITRHYQSFVLLAVLSGFFDWIVFNLVGLMAPGIPWTESDTVYHIFWDLIGFPSAMAAAVFLLWALMGLSQIKLDRRRKALSAMPFAVLGLLSIVYTILRARQTGKGLGGFLWLAFLYGWPAFLVLILVATLVRVFRMKDGAGRSLRLFLLSLLGGILIWNGLTLIPSPWHPSNHWTIIWYFLMLAFPTWALAAHFREAERREILESPPVEDLASIIQKFQLTPREAEILALLLSGKSYAAMKSELYISLQTVKNHVSRIYGKLGVRNRVELANFVRNSTRR